MLNDSTHSVSYRALKILAYIMNEGCSVWQNNNCKLSERSLIIKDMNSLLDKWKNGTLKISYEGSQLDSIIDLLKESIDGSHDICQKCACWILAKGIVNILQVDKFYTKIIYYY